MQITAFRCGAKIDITRCEDYKNTFARIESDCTLRFGFKVLVFEEAPGRSRGYLHESKDL